MNAVLEWMKSALLFGIFSSVIVMLSPDKGYEKHISLAVGMIFILLIMHPIMKLYNVDGNAYISYIRNYFASENYEITDSEMELYGDSISIQLEEVFIKAGYPVKRIRTKVDVHGNVDEISIQFKDNVSNLKMLENYVKNVFGDEVKISYE